MINAPVSSNDLDKGKIPKNEYNSNLLIGNPPLNQSSLYNQNINTSQYQNPHPLNTKTGELKIPMNGQSNQLPYSTNPRTEELKIPMNGQSNQLPYSTNLRTGEFKIPMNGQSNQLPYSTNPRTQEARIPMNGTAYPVSSNTISEESASPIIINQPQPIAYYIIQFEDPIIRKRFIGQVLTTVSIMLAIVGAITSLSYIPFFRKHLDDDENTTKILIFMFVFIAVWVIISTIMFCSQCIRKTYPLNIIFLALSAVSMGLVTVFLTAFVPVIIVIKSSVETFVILIIIGLAARYTRIDATGLAFYWKVFAIHLIISGCSFTLVYIFGNVPLLSTIISTSIVFIYSIYIFIDLQLIMGGKRNAISPNEPVLASIILFTDIMYLLFTVMISYGEASANAG